MHRSIFLFICFGYLIACQSQQSTSDIEVGGPCEGCEAIHEYGSKALAPVDTLDGWNHTVPQLVISGTIYREDGINPAENVILYIYHTNRSGIYETRGDETGWARRHGVHRGWIKTGASGQYTFYTFRPGPYPGRDEPEHIHCTIKEPGKTAYWIDDILFEDDPLLTPEKIKNLQRRGGSGVTRPSVEDGILIIKRDIILGQNVQPYR